MVLKILKLALLILTSVLGVYGTTHDFKKDGKPTRAGRLAVVALILSGMIAVLLQFVEFNKEEHAAKAAKDELEKSAARQNQTLEKTNQASETLKQVAGDIDRGLHAITNMRISFALSLATDSPRMRDYVERVKRNAPRSMQEVSKFGSPEKGIFGTGQDSNHRLSSIIFTPNCILAPQKNEPFARAVFGPLLLEFQFYRHPIDPSMDPLITRARTLGEEPDLSFSVGAFPVPHPFQTFAFGYDIPSGEFQIRAEEIKSDANDWRSNGKIVGVPDLEGTQMFVRVNGYSRLDDPIAEKELRDLQKTVEIRTTMILYLTGGRSCFVDGMQKYQAPNGDPVFMFIFPRGDDFARLVR